MHTIERTLKYVSLYLTKDLSDIKVYPLPEGYRFVFFNDGDEKDWVEIEKSAGEFLSNDEGMEAFEHYYRDHYEELKRMCIFIENKNGEKVATSTAFYLDEPDGDITGNVHWVSVREDYQGKGLSKPLISKTLQIMKELGHKKTMLHTQTTTPVAVKVYLDMGFDPYKIEESYLGWQIIKKLINHPKLSNISDIDDKDMYNPLYVEAYKFLRTIYPEPFNYKVWDEKGPFIGVNKDNKVKFYEYSYKDGNLEIKDEFSDYKKIF